MSDAEAMPRKPNATEKRAVTDAAAQAITDQEVLERAKKAERLRALRLAQAVAPAKAKGPRQK